MTQTNPATPGAQATANPGSNASGQQPAATTTPVSGQQPAATVTITAQEHAQLLRDQGRLKSFQQRASFTRNKGSVATPTGDVNQDVLQAEARADDAEKRALAAEVKSGVNELLLKPEFTNLPESTKALIRKNPATLSEAETVEEALLDIEDFLRENSVVQTQGQNNGQGGASRAQAPTGHETPPVVNTTTPAHQESQGLEDLSKLTGSARSRAALRNSMKKARGVK